MKFAIIIPDGCADEPQDVLGGKTPLEAAHLPAMDSVAAAGAVGRANHTPTALPAGSDTANLSLLGYNPLEHFTGRAPLEAAAQGIELAAGDWAVRCNLVTIEDQVMRDFTAGHISTDEAVALMAAVQEKLGDERLQFYPGVSYRNLLVVRAAAGKSAPFSPDTRTTPPHDLTDQSVLDGYPRGPGSRLLAELMSESEALLAEHPVNVARRRAGKPPATNIWLWGQGSAPRLPPFAETYGVRGAMITAVDLLRGLAKLIGWQRIDVPGATGYTDTDYAAKGRYAIEALKRYDLVCVHVEAPDEASHEGDAAAKVKALEEIDRHIVAPLLEALGAFDRWRILVSPDHPTPLRTKTHSHGDVPLAMAGTGIVPDGFRKYDDPTAARSTLVFNEGWKVMGYFLGRTT
ncbi:MAG: cofactor-independent phosphoglycerate mutase [Thermoguttaceae bacterium]|jgi:2,3-bisphosphoglycerate-independent phosphoglycerate mutase